MRNKINVVAISEDVVAARENHQGGVFVKNVFRLLICVLLFGALLGGPCFAVDLVNINTATVEELTTLPGIGPATAAKIVEYREGHPFATVDEVLEVKGIGPAKFQAIKDRITVGEVPVKKQ